MTPLPLLIENKQKPTRPLHSLNPPPEHVLPWRRKIHYVKDIERLDGLPEEDKRRLENVAEQYPFRSNSYYLSLIDWENPNDPIRRIVVPCEEELEEWGKLDPSNEAAYTVAPGCQHKYPHVAVLLVSDMCGSFCRFCFRKRLFMEGNEETQRDISAGVEYIRAHPQITNVLITGGDPLMLSTRRLESIIQSISEIPHVGVIRIGTKMLAFNPYRVLDDPELLDLVIKYSLPNRHLYFMLHFNHSRELTPDACRAAHYLGRAGAILCNQSPIIRGVNDDPDVLGDLFRRLSFVGISPYYVFQCRPTIGNKPYAVPLARAFSIFEQARSKVAGVAKRARFVMSHATGKIEVVGMTPTHFILRYHRSPTPSDETRLLIYHRDENAYWFDDLIPAPSDL